MASILILSLISCEKKTEGVDVSVGKETTAEALPEVTEPTDAGKPEDTNAILPSENEPPVVDNAPEANSGKLHISASVAPVDWDILINESWLIVSGEVVAEKEPYNANPDGTLKNKYGEQLFNTLNCEYTIHVDKVFKGDVVSGDDVTVTIYNNWGYPPGIDPDNVTSDISNYYLTVGEECIFFLEFTDVRTAKKDPTPESIGYELCYSSRGVCRPDENGVYYGKGFTYRNPFTAEELVSLIEKYQKTE